MVGYLGTKTVTEPALTGWSLTNLQCTGGGDNTSTAGNVATIGLDAGEAEIGRASCRESATITIVTDAVHNEAQDFAFTTTGGGPAAFTTWFSLHDDSYATL